MSKRVKISDEDAKKLEIISIIALIIFALISYFITNFVFKKKTNNVAVYIGDKQITQVDGKTIDINVDGTYTIGDKNGEYNIIEIKNKKICCIDANCPDKICVSHGSLRDDIDNDMIVCAPHKMTIKYN